MHYGQEPERPAGQHPFDVSLTNYGAWAFVTGMAASGIMHDAGGLFRWRGSRSEKTSLYIVLGIGAIWGLFAASRARASATTLYDLAAKM